MPKSYEDKYEKPEKLSTVFNNRLNDLKSEIKVQLPCKVQSVNHQMNQVSVEILDYDSDKNGNLINYAVIPNVPIRQPMDSGSAYIRLPIQVGDIGTIEFFDSNADDLLITDNYSFDDSEEWHSLNNGLFTNGFLPNGKLFEFDYNSKLTIGTKTNKFIFTVNNDDELEVLAEKITVTSKGDVEINVEKSLTTNVTEDIANNSQNNITENASNDIILNAGAELTATASIIRLNGMVAIDGDVQISGNVVCTGEVTANQIPLSTHKHTGVTSGPNTTGTPTV